MAWLDAHPPRIGQWSPNRARTTGCTVLHTAEGVLDTIGPDTGAENVARFIQGRTTYGSYHHLVDSDSRILLVELVHAAYHDGTGSNWFATSLSFACATHHWRAMAAAQRKGFLRQGALAFAEQQLWRKAAGHPLTRLRYITKAQSDAGESGITCHGWRDPSRRSDPGVDAPDLFPFDEFLDACSVALGELMPEHPDARRTATQPAVPEEDDMPHMIRNAKTKDIRLYIAGVLVPVREAADHIEARDTEKVPTFDVSDSMFTAILKAHGTV